MSSQRQRFGSAESAVDHTEENRQIFGLYGLDQGFDVFLVQGYRFFLSGGLFCREVADPDQLVGVAVLVAIAQEGGKVCEFLGHGPLADGALLEFAAFLVLRVRFSFALLWNNLRSKACGFVLLDDNRGGKLGHVHVAEVAKQRHQAMFEVADGIGKVVIFVRVLPVGGKLANLGIERRWHMPGAPGKPDHFLPEGDGFGLGAGVMALAVFSELPVGAPVYQVAVIVFGAFIYAHGFR